MRSNSDEWIDFMRGPYSTPHAGGGPDTGGVGMTDTGGIARPKEVKGVGGVGGAVGSGNGPAHAKFMIVLLPHAIFSCLC